MEDRTDYLVSGMGWAVYGSVRCTADWMPHLLELLAQVFPEPSRGTIYMSVSTYTGTMNIFD